MKKKSLANLSLNKKTIANLNDLSALKGGSSSSGAPSVGLCITEQTCIGSADPFCGLGSDACSPSNFICPIR